MYFSLCFARVELVRGHNSLEVRLVLHHKLIKSLLICYNVPLLAHLKVVLPVLVDLGVAADPFATPPQPFVGLGRAPKAQGLLLEALGF